MHPRLIGEINEVRFGDRPPLSRPDARYTGIGTNTREAQGADAGSKRGGGANREFHHQTGRQARERGGLHPPFVSHAAHTKMRGGAAHVANSSDDFAAMLCTEKALGYHASNFRALSLTHAKKLSFANAHLFVEPIKVFRQVHIVR